MINNLLLEILCTIAEHERISFKSRQGRRNEGIAVLKGENNGKGMGRPKTKYPKDFKKAYDKWRAKEISLVDLAGVALHFST